MKNPSLYQSWLDEFWEAIRDDSAAFLMDSANRSEGYHSLVDQVYRSLIDYVPRGRGLASSFILATYRGYRGSSWREIVRVATAFELLSKAVLIIDDIVDDDTLRCGSDSVHRQFEKYASKQRWFDPTRLGNSTGIFAGQMLTSLAYKSLVSSSLTDRKLRQVLIIFLEAWQALDESQVADLAFEQQFPTRAEWFQMATRRAASHVSTSLRIGAALANRSALHSTLLAQAGAELGYMYDIRADLLDSFGRPSKTSVRGRDLRMRKKPLFMCIALEEAPPAEREKLRELFIVEDTPSNRILEMAARWGVTPSLEQLERHRTKAARLIEASSLGTVGKEFFQKVINSAGSTPILELQKFS